MLSGKNIVITGCNRGIGLAILRACAQNGANIWACMKTMTGDLEEELANIAKQCKVRIIPVVFDLKKEDQIKEAAGKILEEKLPVDGIINNAGITGPNRLFTMTSMDEIREVFEVNFFSSMYFIQRLLKNMIKHKGGAIVNISSVAALDGEPGQLEYVASKAAVIGATKKLSSELGKFGIRVNSVAPGIIDTDMIKDMEKNLLKSSIDKNVLHRLGRASEIAEMVVFLISEKSSYITGQIIRVDGGM